jgi:hypothetical protein
MGTGSREVGIQLTENEEKIFNILKETLKYKNLDTVLRCAGGWVRDKLLKKESKDMDIAIDNMMGVDFANHINSYQTSLGHEEQHVRPSSCLSGPLNGLMSEFETSELLFQLMGS